MSAWLILSSLMSCTLPAGVRENHLQKALLRVRPHLPTAASLAAVTAAAEEAKQKAQQRALPKLASSASLAAAAKPAEEDLQPCPTAPAGAVASNPAEATSVIAEKPASSAPSGALSGDPDQASGSTGLAPMEVDTVPAQQSTEAQPAESRPEAGEEADAGKEEDAGAAEADERQLAEPSKQAIVQLPASELERSVIFELFVNHVGLTRCVQVLTALGVLEPKAPCKGLLTCFARLWLHAVIDVCT